MTRICYVIPTLGVGGTERQLLTLASRLKDDYEVTVICTQHAGVLGDKFKENGIFVKELGLSGG